MVKLPAHFQSRIQKSHLRLLATIAFLLIAALLSRGLSAPLGQEPVVVGEVNTVAEAATPATDSASTYGLETIARAQQQLAVVVPEQSVEQLLLTSASDFTEPADVTSSAITLVPAPSFEDPEWSMNELHPHLPYGYEPRLAWANTRGGIGLIGAMPFAGGGGGGSPSSPGSFADSGLESAGGRSSSTQPGVGGGDNAGADQGQTNGNGSQGSNGNDGNGNNRSDATPNYRDPGDDSQNFDDGRGSQGVGPAGPDSTPVAVPEPASLLLAGVGLAGLMTVRRRRNR